MGVETVTVTVYVPVVVPSSAVTTKVLVETTGSVTLLVFHVAPVARVKAASNVALEVLYGTLVIVPAFPESALTVKVEEVTVAILLGIPKSGLPPMVTKEFVPAELLILACQWYVCPGVKPVTVTTPVTGEPEYATGVPELVTVLVRDVPFCCISTCGVRESEVFNEDIENFKTAVVPSLELPELMLVVPSDLY